MSKKKTIIWSIDPFEVKNLSKNPILNYLKGPGRGHRVIPFSLVSPGGLAWPLPVPPPLAKQLYLEAFQSVSTELKKLRLQNIATPIIRVAEASSKRELVDSLIRFSRKTGADYIAVNSRRLKSTAFFRMGGFTE